MKLHLSIPLEQRGLFTQHPLLPYTNALNDRRDYALGRLITTMSTPSYDALAEACFAVLEAFIKEHV